MVVCESALVGVNKTLRSKMFQLHDVRNFVVTVVSLNKIYVFYYIVYIVVIKQIRLLIYCILNNNRLQINLLLSELDTFIYSIKFTPVCDIKVGEIPLTVILITLTKYAPEMSCFFRSAYERTYGFRNALCQ
jgi:hypothetical protein